MPEGQVKKRRNIHAESKGVRLFRQFLMKPGTLPRLHALSWRVFGRELGHEGREDLIQDSLLRALEQAHNFRGTTEPEMISWFLKILRNIGIDEARRSAKAAETVDERLLQLLSDNSANIDAVLEQEETRTAQKQALESALEELTDTEQAVINLLFRYNYSAKDAAHILGKEPPAFRMALSRALEHMRYILGT